MRVPQTAGRPANIINHVICKIDKSYSMGHLTQTVIKVFDGFIAHLASQSQLMEQETRITVYLFSDYGQQECVIWDKDVLRMPSLAGMYRADGNTALIQTTMLATREAREIPQRHGDHSFLFVGWTDGDENDSARPRTMAVQSRLITGMREMIEGAPENETYALFVPNQVAVHTAKQYGYPAANISVWDATSAQGMEQAGLLMRNVADAYMAGRAQGVRGYSARSGGGLFKMRDVSSADVQASLSPLTTGSYTFHHVPADGRIDEFVASVTGRPYQVGRAYYQLSKAETIQPQKTVVIETPAGIFSGPEARDLLGLPDHHIKAGFRSGDLAAGLTVFVQSTSHNRKLKAGTRLLVMR